MERPALFVSGDAATHVILGTHDEVVADEARRAEFRVCRDEHLRIADAHGSRGATEVRVGDAEMLVSTDPELGAASFVGGYLVMGSEDDVRRCVAARSEERRGG